MLPFSGSLSSGSLSESMSCPVAALPDGPSAWQPFCSHLAATMSQSVMIATARYDEPGTFSMDERAG